jgi:hypothetical protein
LRIKGIVLEKLSIDKRFWDFKGKKLSITATAKSGKLARAESWPHSVPLTSKGLYFSHEILLLPFESSA